MLTIHLYIPINRVKSSVKEFESIFLIRYD